MSFRGGGVRQVFRSTGMALLGVAAFAGGAAACSYVPRSPVAAIPTTSFAFRGTVTAVQEVRRGEWTVLTATVTVAEALKGEPGPTIQLHQAAHDATLKMGCGGNYPFTPGWQGLIYAEPPTERAAEAGLLPAPGVLTTSSFIMFNARQHETSVIWQLRELRDRWQAVEAALGRSPDALDLLLERARIIERLDGRPAGQALYRALIARDPGAIGAQLALLRSLAVPPQSVEFRRLRAHVEALAPGDAAVEAQVAQARYASGESAVALGRRDFRGWVVDGLQLQGGRRGVDLRQ
ncbi:hypothetical protein, partial [Teichococcus deserti]|uniref:hypothetical protein n=1 Tax=Teichococcus deserti TaxID=1817963 RepID=UPI001055C6C2